jgi:hypothetical protein
LRYAAAVKRWTSVIVLLALASSPAVARVRYFCRFTGVEITDCEEQRVPDAPIARDDGCCERRATATLGQASVAVDHIVVAPVLVTVAPVAIDAPPPAEPRTPNASGPPLFLSQRTLLI